MQSRRNSGSHADRPRGCTAARSTIRGFTALVFAGVALTPADGRAQQPAPTPALVFDQVIVVDVEHGQLLPAQRVVVVENHITAVGKAGAVKIPRGARVVDARGRYLIPGLWDVHIHTGLSAFSALGTSVASTEGLNFTPELQHRLLLANGVTGVRDAWSPVPLDTLVRWRREILAGTRVGPPRQLFAGAAVDTESGCSRGDTELTGHACVIPGDSADIGKLVRSLKAAGATFLKTYHLDARSYFMVAAAARREGLRFGGHAPNVSPFDAADSGASILDHVGQAHVGILDSLCFAPSKATIEGCRAIAERFKRTNTWSTPTLSSRSIRWFVQASPDVIPNRLVQTVGDFWAGAPLTRTWLAHHEPLPAPAVPDTLRFAYLKIPMEVGLPILSGGDTGMEEAGFKTHDDMAIMVDLGLTPLAALQAATLNPAKMLRATDSLGTVAPGKLADLVLLDADPLADITNTTQVRAVVANGRYFDRAALDGLLAGARTLALAPSAPFAGPLSFDTTQVAVTEADFAHIESFLRQTAREQDRPTVRQLIRRHTIQYPMAPLGRLGAGVSVPPRFRAGTAVPIPDYALVADSVPVVARALAATQLTGKRYLQLSRTLNTAAITARLGGSAADTGTVVDRNVAFLRAHSARFIRLVQLGLDVMVMTVEPQPHQAPAGAR